MIRNILLCSFFGAALLVCSGCREPNMPTCFKKKQEKHNKSVQIQKSEKIEEIKDKDSNGTSVVMTREQAYTGLREEGI